MSPAEYLEHTAGRPFYLAPTYDGFRRRASPHPRIPGRIATTWVSNGDPDNAGPIAKVGEEIREHGGELVTLGCVVYMTWPAPTDS